MRSTSEAKNYEWDGPYTAWSVDEVCSCDSRYCADCVPARHAELSGQIEAALTATKAATTFYYHPFDRVGGRFWLRLYKIKRWLFKPTPWNK